MGASFHVLHPGADFGTLFADVALETLGPGRWGAHLTRGADGVFPLVRTTTRFIAPAEPFLPAHVDAAARISAAMDDDARALGAATFNHALLEVYDDRYTKMGYHSDQALDLSEDSWIALLSCYDGPMPPSGPGIRMLWVKSKTGDERFSIPLSPGSVVVFSTQTNARYTHKIGLPAAAEAPVRWLGLTLRCSKTLVRFDDGVPILPNGQALRVADDSEARSFYRLRGAENREVGFAYPNLDYTISPADLERPRTLP